MEMTLEQQQALARSRARARALQSSQAVPATEQPGMMESAARGFVQGGTVGFGDEIMGAIGATIAQLSRPDLFEGQSAGDMYREGRDIARADEKAAREANPWTYGLSELAGGVTAVPVKAVTPLSAATRTGRIGNAAATGAMYGAGYGAGGSEADLTKGDIGGLAVDTAKGAGIGAATGGVLQGALETPGAVMELANKTGNSYAKAFLNYGDDGIKAANQTQFSKEGAALEKRVGVKFSEAERTGSQRAAVAEDWLANRAGTADRVAQVQKAKVDKLSQKFEQTLNSISREKTGAMTTGTKVDMAFNDAVNGIREARRVTAGQDFAMANKLAGDAEFIQPNNFLKTLEDFIAQGSDRIATPAQRSAASQAKALYGRLVKKTANGNLEYQNINIRELQNGLSAFGDAAKNPQGIWKGIATAGDRRFAANAFRSLLSDLDDAVAGKYAANPEAVKALAKARDNYRGFSQQIDKIEGSVLGKYLGQAKAPEDIAAQITRMEPSEISVTLGILDKHAPDVANNVRRFTLENALRTATSKKGQMGAAARGAGEAEPMSIANMLKNLPDDAKLNSILWGNKTAASEVRDIAAAFERMEKLGGWRRGSQTGQRNMMENAAGGFSVGDLAKPGWYARMIAQQITPDKFADILLNDGARRSFAKEIGALDKAARAGVVGSVKKMQQSRIPVPLAVGGLGAGIATQKSGE